MCVCNSKVGGMSEGGVVRVCMRVFFAYHHTALKFLICINDHEYLLFVIHCLCVCLCVYVNTTK